MVVKIEFCLVFGGDGVVVTSITGGDDMQLSVEISDVLSKTKPQMGKPKAESKKKHMGKREGTSLDRLAEVRPERPFLDMV